MKKTGKRRIPEEVVDFVETTICDVCGVAHRGNGWERQRSYEIIETHVKIVTGDSYPTGGYTEERSFDICPNCFKEKLIPFIESFGAIPTINEVDW